MQTWSIRSRACEDLEDAEPGASDHVPVRTHQMQKLEHPITCLGDPPDAEAGASDHVPVKTWKMEVVATPC